MSDWVYGLPAKAGNFVLQGTKFDIDEVERITSDGDLSGSVMMPRLKTKYIRVELDYFRGLTIYRDANGLYRELGWPIKHIAV